MTNYEELLNQATSENIGVLEKYDLSGTHLKGLYCDNFIALNKDIKTDTEKACVLAEELGHYYTTAGDILDQRDINNVKQELKARFYAYNKLIGLAGIISAYKAHCTSLYEIAEYLNVSDEFLNEAIECYRNKYGTCVKFDNYTIYFNNGLVVFENIM